MRVTASVIIEQPIRAVFAYIADLACWPQWMTGIWSIERRSTRSLGIGETFDRVDQPDGHGLRSTWEVTEHAPPRLLGCRRIAGGSPAIIRQVLEAVDGATRLTVCSEGEVAGVLAGGPDVEPLIARQIEYDLSGLKVLLERQELDNGSFRSTP